MLTKNKKKTSFIKSIIDFIQKYGKVISAFAAVAGVAYAIGFKHSDILREREILEIENRHSAEILNLKEEYMDKYFQLREKLLMINQNDSKDGNEGL